MILFPQAKINLGLNVHFKRPDGYHELSTCMVAIPLYDILEILPASKFSFQSSGLLVNGNLEDNLCVKAYQLMVENFSISPVQMYLRKQIPMGAGLGGGSADAAFVLSALNEMFELNCGIDQLESFAAKLGSDCPFFIRSIPQMAKGRGELLEPISLDLKGYFLYVVNPSIHVSTKEAYDGITFVKHENTIETILAHDFREWKSALKNDFEVSIFHKHPILEQIKATFYEHEALYASMSGSGSTMFALFKEKPDSLFDNASWSQWILEL